MERTSAVARFGFGALATGAVLTLVAPLVTLPRAAQADRTDPEETVVTVSTSRDREPTVLKLEPMKKGDVKVTATGDGTPVTITRTDEGYTVKVGEKEMKVRSLHEGDGTSVLLTGDGEKRVEVSKHAYVFRSGDAPRRSAADVLRDAKLDSVEKMDVRTRGAVEGVLQELLDKGTVIAPGLTWVSEGDEPGAAAGGDRDVRVIVIRKEKPAKAGDGK